MYFVRGKLFSGYGPRHFQGRLRTWQAGMIKKLPSLFFSGLSQKHIALDRVTLLGKGFLEFFREAATGSNCLRAEEAEHE